MPNDARVHRSRALFPRPTTLAVAGLLACAACGNTPTGDEEAQTSGFEWVQVTYGGGIAIDVAVLTPEDYAASGSHPLIVALPWGGGTASLALGPSLPT